MNRSRPHAISLVGCLLLSVGCRSQLHQGLDEQGANESQTALAEHGIDARKSLEPGKVPSWSVSVPSDRSAEAMRLLADLGLPRKKATGLAEVFEERSLVPTPIEERALLLQALAGELSQTLEALDGVHSARVHLTLPAPARPGSPRGEAKASAFLKVRKGALQRVEAMKDDLRALIAGAVEDLTPDGVTLLLTEAAPAPAQAPTQASGPEKRTLKAVLVAILAMLMGVLGLLGFKLHQARAGGEAATKHPPPRLQPGKEAV